MRRLQLVLRRHTNTVNVSVPTLELEILSRCVCTRSIVVDIAPLTDLPGVRHGVEAIYHGSYIDDEGMDMLEAAKTKHIVAPAINWLIATLNEAEAFGYSHAQAEKVGYKRELDAAIKGLREMHRRGIVVLPGGDYGFAWTPHGTYARDLEHFVKLLDFTPHETLIAATAGVAKLMMRSDTLGKIQPGYFGDCILIDGNPLDDITILQDHSKLNVICINGRVHKAGRKEYIPPPVAGENSVIVPEMEYPDMKKAMQKNY
jgi:imidazolonepropionase-like amidohydrolase